MKLLIKDWRTAIARDRDAHCQWQCVCFEEGISERG